MAKLSSPIWLFGSGILSNSGGSPAAPEINVKGNSVSIANGDASPSAGDHTDFGTTPIGTTVTRTFTIENTGNADLTLSNPTVPTGFTRTADPTSPVAGSGSTTFQVRSNATAVGTFSGNISIVNNDADENPYAFAISSIVSILTANLVSWHDASDAATLFEDSAGTTPAADNADVIGRWADKSGNGYHLTQGTTAAKPTLRTAVKNGLNVIRGDGTDDILSNTSYADFGDVYTIYAVAVNALAGNGDTTQALLYVSNGTANTGFSLYHDTVGRAGYRDTSANRIASQADLRNGTWHIHKSVNTGSQGQYSLDNAAAQTVAYTAPNGNTLSRLEVFGTAVAANFFHFGDIAEILVYSTNHDATQQSNMLSYLNAKWAVY